MNMNSPRPNPYELDLETFNVADPALFQAGLEAPFFERLRDEAPVHYCPDSAFGPYWSITRYHDIMAVDKDHQRFSS
ncbi:MAG: cytochrome P450, partial [Pseudomonadales bacterium]